MFNSTASILLGQTYGDGIATAFTVPSTPMPKGTELAIRIAGRFVNYEYRSDGAVVYLTEPPEKKAVIDFIALNLPVTKPRPTL